MNESINEICENTNIQWNEMMKTVQGMKVKVKIKKNKENPK